jgi:hypothetical protein
MKAQTNFCETFLSKKLSVRIFQGKQKITKSLSINDVCVVNMYLKGMGSRPPVKIFYSLILHHQKET